MVGGCECLVWCVWCVCVGVGEREGGVRPVHVSLSNSSFCGVACI